MKVPTLDGAQIVITSVLLVLIGTMLGARLQEHYKRCPPINSQMILGTGTFAERTTPIAPPVDRDWILAADGDFVGLLVIEGAEADLRAHAPTDPWMPISYRDYETNAQGTSDLILIDDGKPLRVRFATEFPFVRLRVITHTRGFADVRIYGPEGETIGHGVSGEGVQVTWAARPRPTEVQP